jgi:hypothetical protein
MDICPKTEDQGERISTPRVDISHAQGPTMTRRYLARHRWDIYPKKIDQGERYLQNPFQLSVVRE